MVFVDGNLLQSALYQGFIEFCQVCTLFLDEILQLGDSTNLLISGESVDGGLFALFTECENLLGNLIVAG